MQVDDALAQLVKQNSLALLEKLHTVKKGATIRDTIIIEFCVVFGVLPIKMGSLESGKLCVGIMGKRPKKGERDE